LALILEFDADVARPFGIEDVYILRATRLRERTGEVEIQVYGGEPELPLRLRLAPCGKTPMASSRKPAIAKETKVTLFDCSYLL
jgi:hypothetical protein